MSVMGFLLFLVVDDVQVVVRAFVPALAVKGTPEVGPEFPGPQQKRRNDRPEHTHKKFKDKA